MEVTTLAEVFLGFGGQTMFILGTACNSIGVVYAINRITGFGINLFSNLPSWFSSKPMQIKPDDKPAEVVVTKEQIKAELLGYSKIILLILCGVTFKFMGSWLSSPATIAAFNSMLYKKQL